MEVSQGGTLQATSRTPAPNVAAARQKAVEAWKAYLALLRSWGETRLAFVGDGGGNVFVSGSQTRIYIRLGSLDGAVAEALITMLYPQQGDIVLVRRERPGGLGPWLVIDWYGNGIVPVRICETDLQVWFLYSDQTFFHQVTAIAPTVAERAAWYVAFGFGYTPKWITPSTPNHVVVVSQEGGNAHFFYSPNSGGGFAPVHTAATGIDLCKPRFDRTNRNLGWAASWLGLQSGEATELAGAVSNPGIGFTALGGATTSLARDYLPVRVHTTADSGQSWSDANLEYLASTYPFTVKYFWNGDSIIDGADPSGSAEAAIYCASPFGPHFGVYYPSAGGLANGFILCASGSPPAPQFGNPIAERACVAPLHDGAHCYLAVGLKVHAPDTNYYDDTLGATRSILGYTHGFYKVDAAGAVVDSFKLATDGSGLGGEDASHTKREYFTWLETDPTDTNTVYALVSRWQFGSPVTTTPSGKLYRLDWAGRTLTDISPHTPLGDVLERVVVTDAGTLLAHVAAGYSSPSPTCVMYRSTDQGATWSSQDLTAALGVGFGDFPMLDVTPDFAIPPGMLCAMTNDGKFLYSTDDGVTWSATSAALVANGSRSDYNPDMGA